MEPFVIATLAFALGLIVGGYGGLRFAGSQFGRQIKADIAAGRLSREEATRLAELPDVRKPSQVRGIGSVPPADQRSWHRR